MVVITSILLSLVTLILRGYIINKVILFGFSHLYAGMSNYPRVFYREEKNIAKILIGTQVISYVFILALSYFGASLNLQPSVYQVAFVVVKYGPYIATFFLLYFGPLQSLETSENGRFTIAFFYSVLACILTLLLEMVL